MVLNSCNRNRGVNSMGGSQESKPVPRHPSYSLRALYNQAAKKTAGDAAPARADAKEHLSWPSRGPDLRPSALMCPQWKHHSRNKFAWRDKQTIEAECFNTWLIAHLYIPRNRTGTEEAKKQESTDGNTLTHCTNSRNCNWMFCNFFSNP